MSQFGGMPLLGGAQSGGGGGSYTAQAVHFDGSAWLDIASLTSTDNTLFSFAGWVKITAGVPTPILFVADAGNNYNVTLNLQDNGGAPRPVLTAGDATFANAEAITGDNATPAQWICIMGTITTTAAEIGKIYIGDTDVTDSYSTNGGSTYPFNIATNGRQFTFGSDTQLCT